MRLIPLLCFVLLPFNIVSAQELKPQIIHKKELLELLNPAKDTLHVINFWATFCKPCVEELPVFRSVEADLKDEKIRFIYISLDFKSRYDQVFLPFVNKNLAGNEVYLLDEPDANSWIDAVESQWSGEIPFTSFRQNNPGSNTFYSGEQDSLTLINNIKPYLK